MSVMTYTCSECGDTGREVLEVIDDQNYCDSCIESLKLRKIREARRCVCGLCECNYKLDGYADNEDICGACINVCYGEGEV